MRITKALSAEDHHVFLRFEDGTEGIVDLANLAGRGVFAAWSDQKLFSQVSVNGEGALQWPGDLDLCPDALYFQLTGKTPAEVFSSAPDSLAHA